MLMSFFDDLLIKYQIYYTQIRDILKKYGEKVSIIHFLLLTLFHVARLF